MNSVWSPDADVGADVVRRFWLWFLPAPGLASSEKALRLNGRRAGCGLSLEAEQVQSEYAVREKSV